MPYRIPLETIILNRGSERVKPAVGKPFNFTQAEVDYLQKANPDCIRTANDTEMQMIEMQLELANRSAAAEDTNKAAADKAAADKAAADKAAADAAAEDAAAKIAAKPGQKALPNKGDDDSL